MFIYTGKKTGSVLEITAYRVPGEKNPRQRKVCIGKRDKDGKFIPNKFYIERTKKEELESRVAELQAQLDSTSTEVKKKGKEVKALSGVVSSVSGKKKTGLTYALDHIATVEGFVSALYAIFGEKRAKQILSISYYVLATKNEALDDFSFFDMSHVHPCGSDISSSESSAILASVQAEHVNGFFKAIRKKGPSRSKEDHFCAFDGTAFSSYSDRFVRSRGFQGKAGSRAQAFRHDRRLQQQGGTVCLLQAV